MPKPPALDDHETGGPTARVDTTAAAGAVPGLDGAADRMAAFPPLSTWRRMAPWAVAVIFAVAAATGTIVTTRDSAPLPGIARDPALTTTGISLVDHGSDAEGVSAGLAARPGGVNVVYFGYLSCPDVCPTTMADIGAGIRSLPTDVAEKVEVTFVTVDPERDDPEAIRTYMGHFFAPPTTIHAVRADGPTALDEAAAQLGMIHEVADHDPGAEVYDVAHSAITYLVDEDGIVVRELPFGAPPEDFATIMTAIVD